MTVLKDIGNSVMGHRGASGVAPENTLSALKLAAMQGVGWVEFDVKITSDDVAILFHDDTLMRTSNGFGNVSQLTYDEISKFDVGVWRGERFRGESIPTLQQAFDLMRTLGLSANIELKPCAGFSVETAKAVARLIQKEIDTFPGELIISSFDEKCLQAFADIRPGIPSALLFFRIPWDWKLRAERIGVDAIHCLYKRVSRVQIKDIIHAGYPVRCFTVNSPHVAKRLFDWGVESIITDYPSRLVRALYK